MHSNALHRSCPPSAAKVFPCPLGASNEARVTQRSRLLKLQTKRSRLIHIHFPVVAEMQNDKEIMEPLETKEGRQKNRLLARPVLYV